MTTLVRRLSLVPLVFALVAPAAAQVVVAEPWVRATVPQQSASGAFMTITSPADAKLVEARSPVAGVVELHLSSMENNMMRMRPVPSIELPAGRGVELKPGGYHVMLMDLKQQLQEGARVPITLTVEGKDGKRETVRVEAPVRSLTTPAKPMVHHKH